MSEIGYSPVEGKGLQRTDMHCHQCSKSFIAEIDFDVNGNHVIECPHCGHEHCRTVKNGKITDDRWASRSGTPKAKASTWKSSVIQARTSTVAQFLRDQWLNRSDL